MPEFTVVVEARKSQTHADIIVKKSDGKRLVRRVTWAKVDTVDKLAAWLLMQDFSRLGDVATDIEKQITITFDNVTEIDEFGEEYTYRQLVSAIPSKTPKTSLMDWIAANLDSLPAGQKQFMQLLHSYLETE